MRYFLFGVLSALALLGVVKVIEGAGAQITCKQAEDRYLTGEGAQIVLRSVYEGADPTDMARLAELRIAYEEVCERGNE